MSIIGGAGRVGSNTAYALQLGDACEDIVLVDVAAEAAEGEALDLTHGRAAVGGPRVRAGGYEAVAGSDIVVVTAGLRRRPDESRLQLIERNAALFRQIVASLRAVQLAPEGILLVVANPVDVLTYLAATELGWAPRRAIGLGTVLDTLRFRSLLGEKLDLDPFHLEALILGEHGDSMVPVFSGVRYEGEPISRLAQYSEGVAREVFASTRKAGAECLRLKGGAGYAVGLAVREVVAAVLGDTREMLPVSTLQPPGEFEGVAFSLPTSVGRAGVVQLMPIDLSEDERRGLTKSAEVLREMAGSLGTGQQARA
ncbi:MAG: lactate dehydrogenase [Armatimonadota bacterium]|nr:MAG: lactate dehydrogenase [Armatimonadota bacterium]